MRILGMDERHVGRARARRGVGGLQCTHPAEASDPTRDEEPAQIHNRKSQPQLERGARNGHFAKEAATRPSLV